MDKLKILHVDDDMDILAIAKLSLEDIGEFEIQQCISGDEALTAVSEFTPDILLLDVMMPSMSGDILLQNLRKIPRFQNTPAIFMTAIGQAGKVTKLGNTDAIGIISKPFDPVLLPEQIRSMFDAHMVKKAVTA